MNIQNNIKYDCWSSNGENYLSDYCSVIDGLEVGDTIYEGVQVSPEVIRFVSADSVIEDIQCQAYDECGEYAEDFLSNISKEAKAELEKMIAAWVEKHDKPTFWLVENVKERLVTEDEKS